MKKAAFGSERVPYGMRSDPNAGAYHGNFRRDEKENP
jgi:hypothetical protein